MKRTWVVLLILALSFSAFSQTKMFINKNNGTTDSLLLSDVKSISFKSGSSSTTPTGFIQVAGGTFQMGSTNTSDYGASPPHSVTVGSFYMDKTETTYEKWTEVRNWGLTHGYTDLPVGANGYNQSATNNPVAQLNWYDILKWCNARSEKDGLTAVYYTNSTLTTIYRTGQLDLASDAVKWTANGYRLPTEAEWEFAAKGGTKSQGYTYSGSSILDSVAWHFDNAGQVTHAVGTKRANELGLYDMSGNVQEWCWDWYDTYSASAQTDPKGPASSPGVLRVMRGGSYYAGAINCRIADRYRANQPGGYRGESNGFRCVLD